MIRVPILNAEQKFVEVLEAELPEQVTSIIALLSREQASIEYWLEISVSIAHRVLLMILFVSLF